MVACSAQQVIGTVDAAATGLREREAQWQVQRATESQGGAAQHEGGHGEGQLAALESLTERLRGLGEVLACA